MNHPDRVRRNYDDAPEWRRQSDTAAEQLKRTVIITDTGFTANVIEAEEFDTNTDAGDEDGPE